ncbi:MAG: IS4 family transposase [Planctomycetes bacterium]|nr:IS4 family transposase [Planctomycetota bacterium]
MVDEQPRLGKQERRQRRKALEQAQRRRGARGAEAARVENADVAATAQDPPAPRPGRRKRRDVTVADVTGVKYFERLVPLLEPLHDVGSERDKAGNRELHYDQLCVLLLLGLFNPVVDGLRGLQQASELDKIQKRLKLGRASLGSLSEASRVFDAALLRPVIAQLGAQLQPLARDPRLADIPRTLTLVDGTLLSALPLLVQAMLLKEQTGSGLVKWRLHTHFEVDRFVPTRIDVTPNGGGEHDERAVLERTLEADRLYVMDRGYAKFSLFNQIVAKDSSYVCRLRDNSAPEVLEERPLTDADRAAGILSDQRVRFPSGKQEAQPDHEIRLVCIACSPHTTRSKYRGGSTGVDSDGILRIATNLLDVPVEIISLIYQFRWQIELFFRFFKQILGCRHLYFHSQNGIEFQAYCAIIACMLLCLWTGRKPTKRTYEMVCYFFLGLASETELLNHLEKLKRQDAAKKHV